MKLNNYKYYIVMTNDLLMFTSIPLWGLTLFCAIIRKVKIFQFSIFLTLIVMAIFTYFGIKLLIDVIKNSKNRESIINDFKDDFKIDIDVFNFLKKNVFLIYSFFCINLLTIILITCEYKYHFLKSIVFNISNYKY
jgi:hypothetical protein